MTVQELIDETLQISKTGKYEADGEKIVIREIDKTSEVHVYDAAAVKECVKRVRERIAAAPFRLPEFLIDDKDSFVAARKYSLGKTLVLNFANAFRPGGGFLRGAAAQEEMLCRCSTLYRSLTCGNARKMYNYNNAHRGPDCSDHLLISPRVVVFRDSARYSLIKPFETSVITAAAPNLEGEERMLGADTVREIFERKIENVLAVAAAEEYETLILGAWGCGAFANDAKDVANYFYHKLIDERYAQLFKRIVFSVYATNYDEIYNLTQFKLRFISLYR